VMQHTTIAVDLAKSVFEVAVSPRPGRVAKRQRLSRGQFARFLAEGEPATVVMEACGSAHYWGREAQTRGHRVVLLPPHAVRPYVVRNKTDRTDAKALLEATRNDEVRPVPVKSETQQALAALHRPRSAWLATRTARINIVRGLLREFGVVIPNGARPGPVARLGAAPRALPRPQQSRRRPRQQAGAHRLGSVEVRHRLRRGPGRLRRDPSSPRAASSTTM